MFCAGWSRLVKKAKIARGRLMCVGRVQYRQGQAGGTEQAEVHGSLLYKLGWAADCLGLGGAG